MTVFWDVALCILVEIERRFRGAYCLHNQGEYLKPIEKKHQEAVEKLRNVELQFALINICYWGEQDKEDEMGGARRTHGRDDK
jgi:hypothetical protein